LKLFLSYLQEILSDSIPFSFKYFLNAAKCSTKSPHGIVPSELGDQKILEMTPSLGHTLVKML